MLPTLPRSALLLLFGVSTMTQALSIPSSADTLSQRDIDIPLDSHSEAAALLPRAKGRSGSSSSGSSGSSGKDKDKDKNKSSAVKAAAPSTTLGTKTKATATAKSSTIKSSTVSSASSSASASASSCPLRRPANGNKLNRRGGRRSGSSSGSTSSCGSFLHDEDAIDICTLENFCQDHDSIGSFAENRYTLSAGTPFIQSKTTDDELSDIADELSDMNLSKRDFDPFNATEILYFLEKRGAPRPFTADLGKAGKVEMKSVSYPESSVLYETRAGKKLTPSVFTYKDSKDDDLDVITVTDLGSTSNPAKSKYEGYVTEHIVELQIIHSFVADSVTGTLSNGGGDLKKKIPADYWMKYFDQNSPDAKFDKAAFDKKKLKRGPSPVKSKPEYNYQVVYEGLGSTQNRKDFVLCKTGPNSVKANLWSDSDPIEKIRRGKMISDSLVGAIGSNELLSILRDVLVAYDYMNHKTVVEKMQQSIAHVATEFGNIETLSGKKVGSAALWTEYMDKYLPAIAKHGKDWMTASITLAKTEWEKTLKDLQEELKKVNKSKKAADTTAEDDTLKKALESEKKALAEVTAAEKDVDSTTKKVKAAKADLKTAAAALKTKSNAANKKAIQAAQADLTKAEKAAESAREKRKTKDTDRKKKTKDVGKARWALDKKTSGGLENLIDGLKKDIKRFEAYNVAAQKIKMPKAK